VSDSLEERLVKASLQWSLQPSPKTIFVTEIETLTSVIRGFYRGIGKPQVPHIAIRVGTLG
jgi:hypothetical protein